jgi:glyoxylase-like metal-dependent hydrolase (beta-lactamase superfamily II)
MAGTVAAEGKTAAPAAYVNSGAVEPFRLYAIRYAWRDALRREHFYGDDPCGDEPMPMAYYVWLAVSGEHAVVVDAGFTAETAGRRGRTYLASPAVAMAALGVEPARVAHVVLTHLHYDHTGDVAAYPGATFVLQEREMAFWTGRYAARGGRHAVERPDIAFLVDANFDGRIRWVDGDAEVVPGVSVHLVGGHTAGMQVVRVLTADGFAVVASDASHFYANIDEDRPYAIVHSLPAMYGAFDTIRSLADDPRLVVAGHDPAVLDRYPPASPGLEGVAVRIA